MDCKRVYSADGVKLKARHITAIPQGTGSSSSSTNYIMSKDSMVQVNGDVYTLYKKIPREKMKKKQDRNEDQESFI